MIAAGIIGFVAVDLLFLAANLPKITHGGWFPLLVGAVVLLLLTTWDQGRRRVTDRRVAAEGPLQRLHRGDAQRQAARDQLPGAAVYLNPSPDTTPLALRVSQTRLHAIPEEVVIVTVETTNEPHVRPEDRIVWDDLGYAHDGYSHMTLRFGYQDAPDVPRALGAARRADLMEVDFNPYHATYFLSQMSLVPDRGRRDATLA